MSDTETVPPDSARGAPPTARGFFIFMLLAALPVGVGIWAVSVRQARMAASMEERLPVLNEVPDFALTERSGRTFRGSDLRGRVWVADFIFTYCAGPCPMMSSKMARLQEQTRKFPDVALVSFSVDPERDTPEVLREYAERYGADPARWFFLTGDMSVIQKLAVDAFKVGDMKDPILHSTRFILVDATGHIRGYYDSEEPDVVEKLTVDIRAVRGAMR